jgi:hypothetical protein
MRGPSLAPIGGLFGYALIIGLTQSNGAAAESRAGATTESPQTKVALELVGRLPRKPGGRVGYLTLHGKHAYLVNEDAGLQVVDVSNPAAPRVSGAYRPKDDLGPVAVSGDRAYIVEKDDVLRVLEVSDPAQPRLVASRKFPGQVRGLAATARNLYVSMGDALRVMDLSDPAKPRDLGSCAGLQLAGRVTIAGHLAYVAADLHGMRIIDVADPAKPREIGAFEKAGNVTNAAVVGHLAYLADYEGGLYIVDVSSPKAPRQVGQYGDFLVGDVAVAGNYALLAAGGLVVIDVSQPDHPKEIGSFSVKDSDTAWSVAVSGDYVYTISDAGLFVFRLRKMPAAR